MPTRWSTCTCFVCSEHCMCSYPVVAFGICCGTSSVLLLCCLASPALSGSAERVWCVRWPAVCSSSSTVHVLSTNGVAVGACICSCCSSTTGECTLNLQIPHEHCICKAMLSCRLVLLSCRLAAAAAVATAAVYDCCACIFASAAGAAAGDSLQAPF